jgi:hypothetical protein
MISQITIDLQTRKDDTNSKYFVGWLSQDDIPVKKLDLSKGITFLLFPGDEDTVPQLVIRTKMSKEERDQKRGKRRGNGDEG